MLHPHVSDYLGLHPANVHFGHWLLVNQHRCTMRGRSKFLALHQCVLDQRCYEYILPQQAGWLDDSDLLHLGRVPVARYWRSTGNRAPQENGKDLETSTPRDAGLKWDPVGSELLVFKVAVELANNLEICQKSV
jgi:hypothetical protein